MFTYLALRASLTLPSIVLNPDEKSSCSDIFLPLRLLFWTKAGSIKSIADASAEIRIILTFKAC